MIVQLLRSRSARSGPESCKTPGALRQGKLSWLFLAFLSSQLPSAAEFIYPDSASTDGGHLNDDDYNEAYLFDEDLTSAADTADGTLSNLGVAYASAEPPSAGFPMTITLEFDAAVDIEAFHLWNITHPSATGPRQRGVKDFSLTFYDGTGGSGNQIGPAYNGTAVIGPDPGGPINSQTFSFASTYSEVRSVEFRLTNNQMGDANEWVGLRELGFEGTASGSDAIDRISVYFVAGQSNARGQGDSGELSSELASPFPDVLFRQGNSGLEMPADTWGALDVGSGADGGFGPELLSGRVLHDKIGSPTTRIALIKYAKGGTSLNTDWLPGGDASLTDDGPEYAAFQNTVESALQALTVTYPDAEIVLEGMIWQQGEKDAFDGRHADYQNLLTDFIADIRATYGPDLRFAIGQLSDAQTSIDPIALQTIQDAQVAVAAADTLNLLVTTNDLSIKSDDLHFDTAGQIELGKRFAEALLPIDTATPGGVMPLSGGTDWTLEFSDEFDGTALDTSKWGIDVSTSSRDPRWDRGIHDWWWVEGNVSLDGNGNLVLDATKHDANTMYCGSVSSDGKYEPTYGYFEARIKVADNTKDTHTAFWLQSANMGSGAPDDDSAADGAEVDIFESAWFGDYTKAVVQIDGYGAGKNANTKQYDTPNLHAGYHVFGMEWTPDVLKIYYDGELKTTYTGDWVPRVQEWLWLSCGASFGDIGTFQSEPDGYLTSAYVDYVRVWKHPSDTTGPVVSSMSPADGSTGVLASSDLVLTFDESIMADTGSVTIKNLTDGTEHIIDITDGSQVSIDFQQLIINPDSDLLAGRAYAVRVDASALDDLAGNGFAGITDDTGWNFTVASSTEPIVLIGGSIRNGDFNANPGEAVNFSSTDVWYNTKGEQSQVATRSDVAYDGSQNGTLIGGRGFGADTGYAIVEGHSFDISYVWKDDWNWNDTGDEVAVSLFVTDDDTITGTRTDLVTHASGTSNSDSYVAVSQPSVYTATATYAGKRLFAAIETTSSGFARIDNFVLIAHPASLFESWIRGFDFGEETGPADDPEADGMPNLMEFAFGTNPSAADAKPLAADGSDNGLPRLESAGGSDFELLFVRRDDHGTSGSLRYTPQFSSDLETFYDSADAPDFVADSSDDPDYEVVKVPFPTSLPDSQPARFGRVKIEEEP